MNDDQPRLSADIRVDTKRYYLGEFVPKVDGRDRVIIVELLRWWAAKIEAGEE